MFQHTAARRRLDLFGNVLNKPNRFQHTAARRRLVKWLGYSCLFCLCFNTQPPEGGWAGRNAKNGGFRCFNTQPPEGGWSISLKLQDDFEVSTHSRPKAAGRIDMNITIQEMKFQHTAARRRLEGIGDVSSSITGVSTHSRPKAAGR